MMMLCSVGTHVLESLSEIGSFRGRKKSRSSFRWSNRSHFARTVGKGDEFTRFEYEGWHRVAEKYDAVWSSLTRQFIPYLIDAAQVSTSRRIWWNGMFQRRVISSKPSATRESAQLDCWRVKHRTGSRRSCERLKLVSDATQKAIGSPFQWPRTLSSHRNVERQIDFAGIKLEGRAQLRLFEEDEAEVGQPRAVRRRSSSLRPQCSRSSGYQS